MTVFLIIEKVEAILNINLSRPFNKIETGRITVKVINHPGDEVMKVFKTEWTFFTV